MARPPTPRRRARKIAFAKGEYYPKVDLSDLEGRLPSSWSPSSVVTPAEQPADEESVAPVEPAREEEEIMPPPVVYLKPQAAAAPSPAPVASAPRGDADGVLRLPVSLDLPAARPLAAALLEQNHVAVVPGNDCGFDTHVRLSFATSMEQIDKGIDRIGEFLGKLGN